MKLYITAKTKFQPQNISASRISMYLTYVFNENKTESSISCFPLYKQYHFEIVHGIQVLSLIFPNYSNVSANVTDE